MGGSTSKLKRWMGGEENPEVIQGVEKALRRSGTPFVYTRRGSMYFDEDGDVAHEFFEETNPMKRGVKATMRRIFNNLTPQGEVKLPFPCLNVDFPIIIYQDS